MSRGHKGPYVKRTVRFTIECHQKLARLAELIGIPKTSVLALAIDNLHRTRFYENGERRKKALEIGTPP